MKTKSELPLKQGRMKRRKAIVQKVQIWPRHRKDGRTPIMYVTVRLPEHRRPIVRSSGSVSKAVAKEYSVLLLNHLQKQPTGPGREESDVMNLIAHVNHADTQMLLGGGGRSER